MIIPVSYAQINLIFTGAGFVRGAQIAYGVSNDATQSAIDVAAACADIWATELLPDLSNIINLQTVKAKLGPNDTGAEALFEASVAGGVSASQPLSPNVAMLARKHTLLGGRKGRGRFFVPGLVESQTDGGGRLNTAATTTFQDDLNAVLAAHATNNVTMVLLHTDATAPTDVQEIEVEQLFATQRRRIRKVGGRRTVAP